MILAIRGGLPMATTALDETLQRDRTAELSAPDAADAGRQERAVEPLGHLRALARRCRRRPGGAADGGIRPRQRELERRSREWTAMVRLLEQNRHTLDCAEME